jgi:hypothetical protein
MILVVVIDPAKRPQRADTVKYGHVMIPTPSSTIPSAIGKRLIVE